MRHIGSQGLSIIKLSESLQLAAYLCPAGKLTIGYGHVIQPMDCGLFAMPVEQLRSIIKTNQDARKIKIPLHITTQQADRLLDRDTAQTALFIASVTKPPLTQGQFDALCSLAFNIGQGNYAASTLRKKVAAGDFAGAAAEFDRWVYATVNGKKVKLGGLVTRRAAERRLFEGGGA